MSYSNLKESVHVVANAGWDERITVVRCGEIVDAYVVATERYVVFVDTLINLPTADALLALAAPLLTPGRQLMVLNSHADWDHCWGNGRFAGPGATHPAPILAHRLAAERLRSPAASAELAELRGKRPGRYDDVLLVAPNILFDDRLALDGGDLTLELFATPGHQPDHVSVWIPELRTLLAGDAAESPFPFATSAEALPILRRSLGRMRDLAPAQALYCHAPETIGPALLDHNVAYFDGLEACCATALARGVTPADVVAAEGADRETLVAFPFGDAVPAGNIPDELPSFYRAGHQAHISLMVEWLARDGGDG
jgi:glyoxylase-like metal-dependent hydrolase (beta-lactamase superfamily II)